jgi:glycosyltransferase involved in cell wall biosynthesis
MDKPTAFYVWQVLSRCRAGIRRYGVSDYAAEHWQTHYGAKRNRIVRVYNSINSEFYNLVSDRQDTRRNLRIPADAYVVISVGRLVPSKGVDILYEALAPILLEKNMFLLYVGSIDKSEAGAEQLLEKIEQAIEKQDLSSRVVFVGHQKDIAPIMNAADLLVHPTRTEAFGLVLVEAMAVGIPVVASNVDGIPEVLAGTDSVMVEPNDPVSLRKAVLAVRSRTSDKARKAIEKGRLRAQEFTAEKRADAMVALYGDILSGRF